MNRLRAAWERWCAGPYRPRRAAPGGGVTRALRYGGVILWWAVPFIVLDIPAIALAYIVLN